MWGRMRGGAGAIRFSNISLPTYLSLDPHLIRHDACLDRSTAEELGGGGGERRTRFLGGTIIGKGDECPNERPL